jgi:hypothetical protein
MDWRFLAAKDLLLAAGLWHSIHGSHISKNNPRILILAMIGENAMNLIFLRINSKLIWMWEAGIMIAIFLILTYCGIQN